MARAKAPEGAKKIFIDEVLFKKLDKLIVKYVAAKKLAKKNPSALKDAAQLGIDLAALMGNKWEDLKLLSGIKPDKVIPTTKPAPKGKAPVVVAKPAARRVPKDVVNPAATAN